LRFPVLKFGIWRLQGCQHCAPAVFTPRKIRSIHFS
jgi:hypothetical protein